MHAVLAPARAYVNFLTDDEDDARLARHMGRRSTSSLRRIKTRYDPGNLFRGNLNIPPL